MKIHPDTQASIGVLITVLLWSSPGMAQKQFRAGDLFVPGEVLVKYKSGATGTSLDALQARLGASAVPLSPRLPILHVKTPLSVPEAIAAYRRQPEVEYAEPNYIIQASAPAQRFPNDALLSRLWGLHNTGGLGGRTDADIDAPEAWALQTGSRHIVVAVIDTGSDLRHQDKAANQWRNPGEIPADGIDNDGNGFIDDVFGWDFFHDDATVFDPADGEMHGTHTSGIIGARGNNHRGVVGVNWDVQIMTLKILGPGGGTIADAIRAIQYAADMGAHLSNNSWGGGGFSLALKEAIEAAGILFVASAGNTGSDGDRIPHYPSGYRSPNLIAVAATDRVDHRAFFSNFGATTIDLGAPGVDIVSTWPANGYGSMSGTSFAVPHVAGVAALILAHFPHATALEVKGRLLAGVDLLPDLAGKTVTGGRLNAFKALTVPMGQLSGTVTDQHGAPVTHARLALRRQGTNDQAIRLKSNAHGDFSFPGLPAGAYVLRARQSATGFARVTLNLDQGEHRTVALILE